ncbi:unnamed protein product [Allacma fusca]|uniref:BED-type domain-containing protein n=1 Tax=Allacma fusca TaxID=39272 RepID=A0A8J2K8Z9_9HEXA|nr:unnamed protein product [Allacma fusca]
MQSKRRKPIAVLSKYYSFFTWVPDQKRSGQGKWKCKTCGNEYVVSKGGGTGSLKNHPDRSHKNLLPVIDKEIHICQINKTSEDFSRAINCKDGIRRKLPKPDFVKDDKFLVTSNQPFSLVEEEEFRNFVGYCSGNNLAANFPSRTTA